MNEYITQVLMREVQRDHWEGSKPPRVTPRSCADRTSDRGQVGRSATQRRAGENPRFRSSRNPLDSILVLDISGRVPDPGTMLGGRELLYKQILIYYIVLTRRKQLKSHLDTPACARVGSQVHNNTCKHIAPQACCNAPMHRQTQRRRQRRQGRHADSERCTRATSVAFKSFE